LLFNKETLASRGISGKFFPKDVFYSNSFREKANFVEKVDSKYSRRYITLE